MADVTAKLAEALRWIADYPHTHDSHLIAMRNGAREALAAYEQAQAEPKQAAEPVAWIPVDALAQLKDPLLLLRNVPLYAYAGEDLAPIYAAPVAQAEPRKPLTDAQIDAIWNSVEWSPRLHVEIARAIEAAHGIKEQP